METINTLNKLQLNKLNDDSDEEETDYSSEPETKQEANHQLQNFNDLESLEVLRLSNNGKEIIFQSRRADIGTLILRANQMLEDPKMKAIQNFFGVTSQENKKEDMPTGIN